MKKLNLMIELCGIILGVGIYGLVVIGINILFKLVDGGVIGIVLFLYNFFGFVFFIILLFFNLFLLFILLFFFGKYVFFWMIVGIFVLVFFLYLWESFYIYFVVDSLLINSLMIGIFFGIGCGFVF